MTLERAGRAGRPVRKDTAEEFSAVLRPHLDRLGRLVRAQAPPALAEDVRQDTLLRAFRSWHRFDAEQPLWPWLARIAERACATAWEKDARWRRCGAESAISSADAPGSEQHVSALHARAVVAATLADLTPRERALLYRCDAEGAPRHLLAEATALTPGAVRVALHRARHRFRRVAREQWDDLGVAAGVVVTRLRLRQAEPHVQAWAIPAAVFVAAVATAIAQPSPTPATRTAGAVPLRAASAVTEAASSPAEAHAPSHLPAGRASSPEAGSPGGGHRDVAAAAARPGPPSDSPPGPVPRPRAKVDVGPDGVYGGVRVEFVTPDGDGLFYADPAVRCRHSAVTKAICTVTGTAPSTGPVEFYGSGDGDP